MTATVADLQILINADTSGASKAVSNLDSQVKGSSGSIVKSAAGMFAAFQVGSFLKGAIGTVADFEAQLSSIGAVGGKEAVARMKEIKAAALDLGATTSFSASEAAAGMQEMIKAGMSVDDVLNGGAEAGLNLAAATGTAVPDAAALMSTTMNVMGVDATKAADIMVAAANASAMSVEDWGYAMKSAGPIAASLGMDVDDLAKYLVVLSNAGINGEQAGTALRNMMLNLSSSTSGAREAMAAAGVTFTDASGALLPMDDIITNLSGSWSGLSKEQKENLAQTIAGKEGMAAFLTLMEGGTAALDDATKSLENQASASEQAKQMTDNLQGAWDAFMGTIETIILVLLSSLVPALRFITDHLNDLANAMLKADWKGLKKTLQPVAKIFKGMVKFVKDVARAFEIFSKTRGNIQGFFAAIAVALQSLTGINVLKYFEDIGEIVEGLWNTFKAFGSAIIQIFQGDFGGALESAKEGLSSLADVGDALKSLGKNLANAIKKALDSVPWKALFVAAIGVLSDAGSWIIDKLGDLGSAIWEWASNAFNSIDWAGIWDGIVSIGSALVDGALDLGGTLWDIAQDFGSWIWEKLKGVWDQKVQIGNGIIEGLVVMGDYFLNIAKDFGSWLWTNMRGDWNNEIRIGVVNIVLDFVQVSGSWLTSMVTQLVTMLFNGDFTRLGEALGQKITELGPIGLIQFGIDITNQIAQAIANGIMAGGWKVILIPALAAMILLLPALIVAYLAIAGAQIMIGLVKSLTISFARAVAPWLAATGTRVSEAVGDVVGALVTRGLQLIAGLWQGIVEKWAEVKEWLGGTGDRAKEAVGGLAEYLVARGNSLIKGLKTGAENTWEKVKEWLGGLGQLAADKVGDLSGWLYDAGMGLIQGLINGIDAMLGPLDEIIGRVIEKLDKIPSWLRPGSPSKTATEWGVSLGQGLAKGINATIPMVNTAIDSMAYAMNAPMTTAALSTSSAGGSMAAPMTSSRTTTIYQTNHVTVSVEDAQQMLEFSQFLSDLEPERVNTFGHNF